ncbi:MAG TPA: CPBP family intramembrane metalloprotease [Anaerolineae bacterium]|nr:CPBP family intramembrane metalloprotease [Anaerolineae bacterium]
MAEEVPRKELFWFLIVAFGVSWPLFLLPLAFGPPSSRARQVVTMVAWTAAMWGPGLAAIVVTRFVAGRSLGALNLGRLGPGGWDTLRSYLWAWLLPPALAVVTGLLTLALGAGRLDLEFSALREAMAQAPGGKAISPEMVVAIQLAFALTFAPLFNCLFALGEELGWRGFLLPHLLPLGRWKAILLSNVVWGFWHAPAILQGHNYPDRPVLGIFMMIVFCLLMGAVFSWLYLRTGSPWAPTLAHASLNATAGLPMLFLTDVDIAVGGTVASAIGWIGLAAFVGWLILTRRLSESP